MRAIFNFSRSKTLNQTRRRLPGVDNLVSLSERKLWRRWLRRCVEMEKGIGDNSILIVLYALVKAGYWKQNSFFPNGLAVVVLAVAIGLCYLWSLLSMAMLLLSIPTVDRCYFCYLELMLPLSISNFDHYYLSYIIPMLPLLPQKKNHRINYLLATILVVIGLRKVYVSFSKKSDPYSWLVLDL